MAHSPYDSLPLKNMSGLEIKPVYGPEDILDLDQDGHLDRPGHYPYTRGIHETMYRGRRWTVRQLGSLGAPDQANSRIRQLIDMGATGISICFDMPTIITTK